MELVEGLATLQRWLVDGVACTWSGCVSGAVAHRLDVFGGKLLEKMVMLLVVFLWFLEFRNHAG